MRKFSVFGLVLIVGVVLFAFTFQQGANYVEQRKVRGLKDISRQPQKRQIHDFGVVRPSEVLEHVFSIPNSTGQAVRPSTVIASCGCLKATVEKKWYSPDEDIPAKVRMLTNDTPLEMRQELVVEFEDKVLDNFVLEVKALVRTDLYLTKEKLTLGENVGNPSIASEFTISNFSNEDWPSVEVVTDASWVSATCEPVVESSPVLGRQAWTCRVDVNLVELRPGTHKTTLTIRDSLGRNESEIPVELNLKPNIVAFPGSWYFFKNDSSERQSRLILRKDVANTASGVGVVVSDSVKELLEVSLEPKGEGGTEFVLKGRCKKRPEIETSGEIVVDCNDSPANSISIPILIVP